MSKSKTSGRSSQQLNMQSGDKKRPSSPPKPIHSISSGLDSVTCVKFAVLTCEQDTGDEHHTGEKHIGEHSHAGEKHGTTAKNRLADHNHSEEKLRVLFIGCQNGFVHVWSVATATVVSRWPAHVVGAAVTWLDYSRRMDRVVTFGRGDGLRTWKLVRPCGGEGAVNSGGSSTTIASRTVQTPLTNNSHQTVNSNIHNNIGGACLSDGGAASLSAWTWEPCLSLTDDTAAHIGFCRCDFADDRYLAHATRRESEVLLRCWSTPDAMTVIGALRPVEKRGMVMAIQIVSTVNAAENDRPSWACANSSAAVADRTKSEGMVESGNTVLGNALTFENAPQALHTTTNSDAENECAFPLVLVGYESGHLCLWNLGKYNKEATAISELVNNQEGVTCLAFDPVARRGACGITGDKIVIFSITSGEETVSEQKSSTTDINIDKLSLTKSVDIKQRLLVISEIVLTSPGTSCLRIRPDGKLLVAGGWDGRLRVFAWKRKQNKPELKEHRAEQQQQQLEEPHQQAPCLPQGDNPKDEPPLDRYLCKLDEEREQKPNSRRVENEQYNLKREKPHRKLAVLEHHRSSVESIDFSPFPVVEWRCTTLIAAGSADKRLSLWKIYADSS